MIVLTDRLGNIKRGLGVAKGSTKSGDDQLTVLVTFLQSNSLINKELLAVVKNPIRFRPPHGGRPATELAGSAPNK